MRPRRNAFTLFELILAVALSAILLALIGTAINLYLVRVDSDRSRVEEVQLARSVLSMITDDVRGASVYQQQDMSAIAQLMAAGTPFDVDSVDKELELKSGTSAPGGAAALAKVSALSSSSGSSGSTSGSSSSASSASSSGGGSEEESDDTMPLGLNGAANEVHVDVTRMPRQEELFATVTGYTNAPSPARSKPGASGTSTATNDANPPADLKTVHYFVRSGNAVEAGSVAVTSLAPDAQVGAGGLVREEIPRRMRVFAEANGNSSSGDSGMALVAPEVTQIQFRYYDGSQLVDDWDMKERKQLPIAIEVAIWIRSASADSAAAYSAADAMSGSRVYRQVVYLPMSQVSQASAASGDQSSTSSSTESSSSESSSSGSGSAFGEQ